jgi:branched-chain amino acid transport system substrate-binding protein
MLKIKYSLALTSLSLLVIAGLVSSIPKSISDKDIKIGALLCLSGDCAEWGTNTLRGMELAVKEVNQQGGVDGRKLKIIAEDSREDSPVNVISAYRNLTLLKKVKYIVGPTWTPASYALAPVAKKDKAILISPTVGAKEFNETSENLFNIWPHDDDSTRYLARYAFSSGIRKISVLTSQQPWESAQGLAFRDEFIRLGGQVLIYRELIPTETNFRTEVQKLLVGHPDGVFLGNLSHMAQAARILRELNFDGKKFTPLMDQTRLDAALGAFEDTIFIRHQQEEKFFTEKFIQAFGMQPGLGADKGYDAVKLFVLAFEKESPLTSFEVQEKLRNISKYSGASGSITFNEKRAVERAPILWKVSQGSFVKL